MNFIDTHCHIHESDYPLDAVATLDRARRAGVTRLVCVGTTEQSSQEAVEFASKHDGVFAAVGVHPHEVKDGWGEIEDLFSFSPSEAAPPIPSKHISPRLGTSNKASLSSAELTSAQTSSTIQESSFEVPGSLDNVSSEIGGAASASVSFVVYPVSSPSFSGLNKYLQPEHNATPRPGHLPGAKPFVGARKSRGEQDGAEKQKIVAIGEIGLDYFYMHSPREVQIMALEAQIDLALKYNLPIIFHVREAFDDFWSVIDNFHGIRGELHSFTDTKNNLEEGLKRGFYIGINGISTFTKDETQKVMFASVPLERILIETDAPFLTPVPFRGKVNEPAFVVNVAEHIAHTHSVSLEEIAATTTANARALFALP